MDRRTGLFNELPLLYWVNMRLLNQFGILTSTVRFRVQDVTFHQRDGGVVIPNNATLLTLSQADHNSLDGESEKRTTEKNNTPHGMP
jgi:hypothetical protein